jgi:murein DD-endopeptidase MepM/ murein hydrolase activator NlpD
MDTFIIGMRSGTMKAITVLNRCNPKKTRILRKYYRFILLILSVIIFLSWLGGAKEQPVRASEGSQLEAMQTNNSWQYASFPVENFQTYSSPFGYRVDPKNPSKRQFHNGLDIAAPLGSYIRNWWGGRVVDLSDNTGCGTSVTLQSGEWQHIYCHMQGYVEKSSNGTYSIDREGGIQLWLGQEVPAGARIGRVGMTGRTTGPHLHWALKYAGKYVDPALVLQKMYEEQTAYR